MKLRNKKTGEIGLLKIWDTGEIYKLYVAVGGGETEYKEYGYKSLNELNDEWEDYEELKYYWYIRDNGDVKVDRNDGFTLDIERKRFGNYFKTKEEAEKAVEKLKAWKRLKDKGFKFTGVGGFYNGDWYKITFNKDQDNSWMKDNKADLDLLFSGEYD